MPGRAGYSVSGGWASSGTSEGGTPLQLQISTRTGNAPSQYLAAELIEFVGEFSSGVNDEFVAEIGTGSTGSGGSGAGSSASSGGYPYGFNGKENDNEVKGEGAQQDYGMRIYDPRVGRFLSVDPLTKSFSMLTPYQFASNSSIANVDLDGKEAEYYTRTVTYTTVHKTDSYGNEHTVTTSNSTTKHESTGWFTQGNIYTPNGALGTGTLYTIKTQVIDVYQSVLGIPYTEVGETRTAGSVYRLSTADEEQMNKQVDRPQYNGSVQIMILGSGNNMYPDDNTGSKANPNASTILINMKDWSDVFEPIMLGMDPKTPTSIEPPSLSEILNNRFEAKLDALQKEREKTSILLPAGSDSCTVEGTIGPMGTLNASHQSMFITPTKVPHLIPDTSSKKKDTTSNKTQQKQ